MERCMSKIVIVGGGWAGCAAAIAARKQGSEVVLAEKTDLLLGAGNAGGIMRNNGRFTATEENIALGAGELFEITDRYAVHKNVNFPGHDHASFYDVTRVEPAVRSLLLEMGVTLMMGSRAVDVDLVRAGSQTLPQAQALTDKTGNAADQPAGADWPPAGQERTLRAVKVLSGIPGGSQELNETWLEADCFVETTGSSGPMGNCMAYGNGCAMCVQRCPAFGPRVSLTQKAGLYDMMGLRESGRPGAFSGSCKIEMTSLSKKLQKSLKKDGYRVIPLSEKLINRDKLKEKVCQQYALDAFAENVVVLDTGEAKLMSPFFDLETLRQVEGFEDARFIDPLGGGRGNSVRYMSVGRCKDDMLACGTTNLYLGGEKSGFFIGHTEAITTGSLAGYNAARRGAGKEALRLPRTLAVGELLAYAQEMLQAEDGLYHRFTFAGGEFFQRMKELSLYTTEPKRIKKLVEAEGLLNIYNRGSSVVK